MLKMHLLWLSSVCGAGRFNRGHRYKSLHALAASLSSVAFLEMSNPDFVALVSHYPSAGLTFTAAPILVREARTE